MTDNTQQKRSFNLLFTMIVITWLIMGLDILINMVGRKNLDAISAQNDEIGLTIASLKLKQEILDNKLASLSQQATSTETSYSPQAETGTTNNQVIEQITTDSGAIKEGISGINERTAILEAKIDEVSNKLDQADSNNLSNDMVLSAVRLRDAVRDSHNFSGELSTLHNLAENNAELTELLQGLDKYAQSGVPSVVTIKEEFDPIAHQILTLARSQKANPSLMDKVMIQLSSLVNVTKIDANAQGNQIEDVIARAYNDLIQDDLASAIKELSTLPADTKAIAKNWIEKAEGSLFARNAAEKIFLAVVKPEAKS
ncbi:MAG: Mitochondrial inner rane protein [Rickettsiaceae bacterium]|nr:Mitochondrial inner rane protein [Rickettsiaceae bacterium]